MFEDCDTSSITELTGGQEWFGWGNELGTRVCSGSVRCIQIFTL